MQLRRPMDEEGSSWIRRTKFSHTVCHRLDPSRLASIPFTIQSEGFSRLKSRPETAYVSKGSASVNQHIQWNPVTNKQRSVSPIPRMMLSDTFKEARSERKRFSTPHPRRKYSDKRIMGKFFQKGYPESKAPNSQQAPNTSPLRHLYSLKVIEKAKHQKEAGWTKYFDNGGGKVTSVEAADEHMVDLSQLLLGQRFAHGAHSRLYHGIYKDEPVAVKIITVPEDDEDGCLAALLEKQYNREVTFLSRLYHLNIIKFVAACKKPPVYCVITEYLSEGSLRSYLHKLECKSLPLQKLIAIALEIARGMEYIHSHGIIHRDLKPENVLINEGFHMKIADFGTACEEAHCDHLADDPGTYRWMAPEMIKHKQYGRKVDVYSFGLILWEMVAGHIPYEDMNPIQAAYAVVNKNLRPTLPAECPPAMRALIEQCWSSQPEKRPEFWQIVKVLEQFESSLALDGTLKLVENSACPDHRKGLLHWIQKLGPHTSSQPMVKPKFS
ncbi:hypothetical protein Ancab_033844 [Ancistrocladus abbreviatus]